MQRTPVWRLHGSERSWIGILSTDHSFRAPGELLRTPTPQTPRLSPRERQVLSLLVEGRTQAEIAEALQISPATAKTHIARLYAKLQARNRSQALLTVAREGLLPLR